MYNLKDLQHLSGPLLDKAVRALALGLPAREIDDPTGYVCTHVSDRVYKRALASYLRNIADGLWVP